MPAPHAWFRGEGGSIHKMDLPLHPVFADQVAKGSLIEVPAPAGAPAAAEPASSEPASSESVIPAGVDPSLGPLDKPARSDSKAEWVAYARQVSNLSPAEASALTKAELIERIG